MKYYPWADEAFLQGKESVCEISNAKATRYHVINVVLDNVLLQGTVQCVFVFRPLGEDIRYTHFPP